MHSMSTNSNNGQLDISAYTFFMPKISLCAAYLMQLIVMRIYVYVQLSQDPFFDEVSQHHMTTTYDTLHFLGNFLGFTYMIYFGVLTYSAF